MIHVTRADGTRQPFQKEKIIQTCLRMHANREAAEAVANRIEGRLYDGIPTHEILRLIFRYLKRHHPAVKYRTDLKRAIGLLRPKPDFERFIQLLLKEQGYEVTPNQIVRGRCVEHEIDAVARRGSETLLVEIKHHFNHHTYTGLDIPRQAWATFEDLTEGFTLGLNSINFSKTLIICNTKFSEHAIQYANCRGIAHVGWKAPPEHGLERIIEEKRLYPITLLKGLDRRRREKLADHGILLLRQLTTCDVIELAKKTEIPSGQLEELKKKAGELLRHMM